MLLLLYITSVLSVSNVLNNEIRACKGWLNHKISPGVSLLLIGNFFGGGGGWEGREKKDLLFFKNNFLEQSQDHPSSPLAPHPFTSIFLV